VGRCLAQCLGHSAPSFLLGIQQSSLKSGSSVGLEDTK
jgi:hypothetical protein